MRIMDMCDLGFHVAVRVTMGPSVYESDKPPTAGIESFPPGGFIAQTKKAKPQ